MQEREKLFLYKIPGKYLFFLPPVTFILDQRAGAHGLQS
jgi:hypothetical protein